MLFRSQLHAVETDLVAEQHEAERDHAVIEQRGQKIVMLGPCLDALATQDRQPDEVVVVDEHLGVTMTEIIKSDK